VSRDPDEWSARERRALALWRAPEPPPELAGRVLERLTAERGSGGSARPMALAALALVLVAGLFGVRLLASAAGPGTEVGNVHPADGGSAIEANPVGDVRS
jgi:hypothetical protein